MRRVKRIAKSILPYGIVESFWGEKRQISSNWYPRLFNELGEEVVFIYLKDNLSAHIPYGFPGERKPIRIFWDRYNTGLDLQMYGHISIINRLPVRENTKQLIKPYDYEMLKKKDEDVKSLAALFTCSEALLDKYPNAKFVMGNGVWYGTKLYGGIMSPTNYKNKSKLISIVASNKHKVPLHCFRADLARTLKNKGLADAMGGAVGTPFDKISDAFDNYMYNIAIENDCKKYYFTEKILDCFASMTIPVYYGASAIGDFFNEAGIIRIDEPTEDCVLNVIKQCSEQDYIDRLEAVKDNYNRVQNYLSTDDYIYDNDSELFNLNK